MVISIISCELVNQGLSLSLQHILLQDKVKHS